MQRNANNGAFSWLPAPFRNKFMYYSETAIKTAQFKQNLVVCTYNGTVTKFIFLNVYKIISELC